MQIELWLVAVLAVLATLVIQLLKSWRENHITTAVQDYNLGDFTLDTLMYYGGYDPFRPLLISIKGQVYDVSAKRDLYGLGKELGVYAGKECSRALAKGSVDEKDCNDNFDDLTDSELARLDSEVQKLEKFARAVGKVVPLQPMTLEELRLYDGSDPAKPMYIAIKGTIYDVTESKQFYGPDGIYPFAGREVARAFALTSTDVSDCNDNLEGLGKWELDSLQEWEAKFQYKYRIIGKVATKQ